MGYLLMLFVPGALAAVFCVVVLLAARVVGDMLSVLRLPNA